MPKELHAQLARSAEQNESSLNQYIVFLLTWSDTHQTAHSALSKQLHEGRREFVLLQRGLAASTERPVEGVLQPAEVLHAEPHVARFRARA